MVASIGHVILNVSDFERSRAFHDVLMAQLGIATRVVHDDDEVKIVAYQIPGCPLYLRWARDDPTQTFVRSVGLDHICIAVSDREAVDDIGTQLERMQAVVTRPPRAYPEYTERYYALYFRDPDGIPFEVAFL